METKASYLIVGGFVLTLIAGAFFFVIWLAKFELNREYTLYHVYSKESVTGLQVGGLVRFRGIPVGSVTKIDIDPEDVEEIRITIQVAAGTPVKEDTVASLEVQGLTGVAYVQLASGTQESPALKPKPGKRIAKIKSGRSSLERLFASAPQILERIDLLAQRANNVLNDRNIDAFSASLENMRILTASLAAKSKTIESAIDDGAATMRTLRDTASTLDARTKEIADEVGPTVKQIRKTVESVDRLSNELDAAVAENRRPIRDFSAQGLYELTQFVTEARTMVASITRLTNKLEADPARFLFGDQQQGVQAK